MYYRTNENNLPIQAFGYFKDCSWSTECDLSCSNHTFVHVLISDMMFPKLESELAELFLGERKRLKCT